MSTPRRWAWRASVAASTLMALAVAAIWIDSRTPAARAWSTRREWSAGRYSFGWGYGRIRFEVSYDEPPEITALLARGGTLREKQNAVYRWRGLGTYWADMVGDPRPVLQPHIMDRFFGVECWLALAACLLLPALAAIGWLRQRRRARRLGSGFAVAGC